jgi:hypothetical protein
MVAVVVDSECTQHTTSAHIHSQFVFCGFEKGYKIPSVLLQIPVPTWCPFRARPQCEYSPRIYCCFANDLKAVLPPPHRPVDFPMICVDCEYLYLVLPPRLGSQFNGVRQGFENGSDLECQFSRGS